MPVIPGARCLIGHKSHAVLSRPEYTNGSLLGAPYVCYSANHDTVNSCRLPLFYHGTPKFNENLIYTPSENVTTNWKNEHQNPQNEHQWMNSETPYIHGRQIINTEAWRIHPKEQQMESARQKRKGESYSRKGDKDALHWQTHQAIERSLFPP